MQSIGTRDNGKNMQEDQSITSNSTIHVNTKRTTNPVNTVKNTTSKAFCLFTAASVDTIFSEFVRPTVSIATICCLIPTGTTSPASATTSCISTASIYFAGTSPQAKTSSPGHSCWPRTGTPG